MAYQQLSVSPAGPDPLDPRWPPPRLIGRQAMDALPTLAAYARLHELVDGLRRGDFDRPDVED